MKCSVTVPIAVVERFWRYVLPGADGAGCWLWTGPTTDGGYGMFTLGRFVGETRTAQAHRFAWEITNGPIAAGLQIDHTCNVRSCVNISHLDLVTGSENQRRASERAGKHDPKIVDLYRGGLTAVEVGERLNLSPTTVLARVKAAGLPIRPLGAPGHKSRMATPPAALVAEVAS